MKLAFAALLAALPVATLAQAQQPEARGQEPAVQRQVLEDDGVRIEELKVRGQVRSISVQSKLGNVRRYEILPGAAGRDPSQAGATGGQRVWNFLSF